AAFKRIIGFYKKHFPVVIIYHIKSPELTAIGKHIVYKIDTPGVLEHLWYYNRLFNSCRQTFLMLPAQGQAHLLIYPVQAFVVYSYRLVAQSMVALPKPFPGVVYT